LKQSFEEVYGPVDYRCQAEVDVRQIDLTYLVDIAVDATEEPDELHFFGRFFSFAGEVPESLIPSLIGRRPDELVDGFTDWSPKTGAKEWVNESTIKWIHSFGGLTVVGLEPAA
jgi:hypothetical protein